MSQNHNTRARVRRTQATIKRFAPTNGERTIMDKHQELYTDIEALEELKDDVSTRARALVCELAHTDEDIPMAVRIRCQALYTDIEAWQFQVEQTLIS